MLTQEQLEQCSEIANLRAQTFVAAAKTDPVHSPEVTAVRERAASALLTVSSVLEVMQNMNSAEEFESWLLSEYVGPIQDHIDGLKAGSNA